MQGWGRGYLCSFCITCFACILPLMAQSSLHLQNHIRYKKGCRDGVTCVVFVQHVLPAHCHPYTQFLWVWAQPSLHLSTLNFYLSLKYAYACLRTMVQSDRTACVFHVHVHYVKGVCVQGVYTVHLHIHVHVHVFGIISCT